MGKGRWAVEKVGNRTRSLYRKQEGDREIVTAMCPAWFVVQLLLFSRGGLLGTVLLMRTVTTTTMTMMTMMITAVISDGSTNLFISPKWLSQPFGMTVSGFWISAGIPFVPISLALSADKREYGDANLYLAFTRYDGIIPQSPIANRSYLVTGQIFCQ